MPITHGPIHRDRCSASGSRDYEPPRRWDYDRNVSVPVLNPTAARCKVCDDWTKLRKDGRLVVHYKVWSRVYITGSGLPGF